MLHVHIHYITISICYQIFSRGETLHTRNHKSETPFENAPESPRCFMRCRSLACNILPLGLRPPLLHGAGPADRRGGCEHGVGQRIIMCIMLMNVLLTIGTMIILLVIILMKVIIVIIMIIIVIVIVMIMIVVIVILIVIVIIAMMIIRNSDNSNDDNSSNKVGTDF